MEEKNVQCYASVDPEGNITHAQFGKNIIPSDDWDFFFWVAAEINVDEYKVVVVGMKPELVLK